jgi:alkylated DNA nucleotide flippase Atl1
MVNYGQFATFRDISRMCHNLPIMSAFVRLSLREVGVPKFPVPWFRVWRTSQTSQLYRRVDRHGRAQSR